MNRLIAMRPSPSVNGQSRKVNRQSSIVIRRRGPARLTKVGKAHAALRRCGVGQAHRALQQRLRMCAVFRILSYAQSG